MKQPVLHISICASDLQIDGRLTLGENIADNGGVHTAFQAYKDLSKRATQNQTTIRGYTQDQLFFISFAQVRPP